jgi:hypothetical protein
MLIPAEGRFTTHSGHSPFSEADARRAKRPGVNGESLNYLVRAQ